MAQPREPTVLGVIEGDRDSWLRDIGINGTNEQLAAAVRLLKRRAALTPVAAAEPPASKGS